MGLRHAFEVAEKGSMHTRLIRYVPDDYAFSYEPQLAGEKAALLYRDVQADVALFDGSLLGLWGYCPPSLWEKSFVAPPEEASPAKLRLLNYSKFKNGIAYEDADKTKFVFSESTATILIEISKSFGQSQVYRLGVNWYCAIDLNGHIQKFWITNLNNFKSEISGG